MFSRDMKEEDIEAPYLNSPHLRESPSGFEHSSEKDDENYWEEDNWEEEEPPPPPPNKTEHQIIDIEQTNNNTSQTETQTQSKLHDADHTEGYNNTPPQGNYNCLAAL